MRANNAVKTAMAAFMAAVTVFGGPGCGGNDGKVKERNEKKYGEVDQKTLKEIDKAREDAREVVGESIGTVKAQHGLMSNDDVKALSLEEKEAIMQEVWGMICARRPKVCGSETGPSIRDQYQAMGIQRGLNQSNWANPLGSIFNGPGRQAKKAQKENWETQILINAINLEVDYWSKVFDMPAQPPQATQPVEQSSQPGANYNNRQPAPGSVYVPGGPVTLENMADFERWQLNQMQQYQPPRR